MSYIALKNVYVDGEVRPIGAKVEIKDAELAKALLERGSIGKEGTEVVVPVEQSAFEAAQNDPNNPDAQRLAENEADLEAQAKVRAKLEADREAKAAEPEATATPDPLAEAVAEDVANVETPVEAPAPQPVEVPVEPSPESGQPSQEQIQEDALAEGEPKTAINVQIG